MHGVEQRKTWIDNPEMRIVFEKIWKPYLQEYEGDFMFLQKILNVINNIQLLKS